MNQNDKTSFALMIKGLSAVFPRQITSHTIDAYWDALCDRELNGVERACQYLIRNHPKNIFPTPFEIRQAASESFVAPPECRQLEEAVITPKERRWNKMILNLTLKTIEESTRANPKFILPETVETHAREVGFDVEFIERQMTNYFKALKDMGCDSMGRPR